MNQLKAIIIDDEQDARRIISKYIERYAPHVSLIGEADSYASALPLLRLEKPDLVFLDINLGDGTGFELLDNIHPLNFKVIFTTAFDHYAVKAFRYHALDYLLKPIDPAAFTEAIDLVSARDVSVQSGGIQSWIAQYGNSQQKLALPVAEGLRYVKLDQIEYLEAEGSYCRIHFSDQKTQMISKPLKFFSDKLENNRTFLRPHKSYIININFISQYVKEDGGSLHLQSGAVIPISRQKKDEILKELSDFFV